MIAVTRSLTGLPAHPAGFVVNLLTYLLSAFVLFELAVALRAHPVLAVLCVACWLSLAVHRVGALWGLSEPPFMLLVLACLRLLCKSSPTALLLAGLCAAAAIATRYAGLFLLIGGCLALLWPRANSSSRSRLRAAMQFATAPTLVAVALAVRNAMLEGTLRGGNNYKLHPSLGNVAVRLVNGTTRLLGISRHWLLSDLVAESIVSALIAAGIVAVAVVVRSPSVRNRLTNYLSAQGTRAAAAFLGAYAGLLVVSELLGGSGINDRLLLPLVPVSLALLAGLSTRLVQTSRGRVSVIVAVAWCISLPAFLIGQYFALLDWQVHAPPSPTVARLLDTAVQDGGTLRQLLRASVGDECPLLVNEPQLTHGILERAVVGLPTGRYNTGPEWTWQRVQSDAIDRFGIRLVLILRAPELLGPNTPLFFRELSRQQVPDRLTLIEQSAAFRLYAVTPRINAAASPPPPDRR